MTLSFMKNYKGICFATAILMSVSAPKFANAANMLVPVSRSELLSVPVDMSEVTVSDPDIADVYVHNKRKISIIGKNLGRTVVRVFDKKKHLIRTIDVVVGQDLPAIRRSLSELLPYENIGVKMVNTNIALVGEVSSASVADKALQIVNEFVKISRKQAKISGRKNQTSKRGETKLINLLSISGGQQVMLRVRIGEVKRTALKNLGINLQAIKKGGDTLFSLATGGGLANTIGNFTANTNGVRGAASLSHLNSSGNGISAMIEALERDGLFKTLAEPNLVAISGEEAEFLSGGEFPMPVDVQDRKVTIEYKKFGVSVKFTPTVLSENRIRIKVSPEVSEISDESAIKLQGLSLPTIKTRRASTTVELAPGESFMIAGLIQDNMNSSIEQLPGISEIPILSALFRSTSYKREETELVLAITPYLVDPVLSNDIKMPTDNLQPASLMESFFYGALGTVSGNVERISQTPQFEGPIGFMVD